MKDIPTDIETVFSRYKQDLNKEISQVSDALSSKEYATDAFNGGNRDYFTSEDELNAHYNSIESKARKDGLSVLDSLIDDLKEKIDLGLRINTATAVEVRVAIPLILNDESLIRFASDLERRDDYTTILAVSQYGKDDENKSVAANRISNELSNYEKSLSEVLRKTEKYIKQALDGDRNSIDGWSDWIQNSIADSKNSYEDLQKAIDGDIERSPLVDLFAAWK